MVAQKDVTDYVFLFAGDFIFIFHEGSSVEPADIFMRFEYPSVLVLQGGVPSSTR